MVATIRPPHWPEEIFGAIDESLAMAGKRLYRDRCKHCHVPETLAYPSPFGQRYHVTMISADEVGTDSRYLEFAKRTVATGVLEDDFGAPLLTAMQASEKLTTTLMTRVFPDAGPNEWRAQAAYMARPHAGLWATPPFLHNGSVPTVYDLLSPVEERMNCFILSDLEYDPHHMGYAVRPCTEDQRSGEFRFDTSQTGNSMAGHEFRKDDHAGHVFTPQECESFKKAGQHGILGCELTPYERLAIIEYLKTCDLDDVKWNPHEVPNICRTRRVYLPE